MIVPALASRMIPLLSRTTTGVYVAYPMLAVLIVRQVAEADSGKVRMSK